jgi:hypothetical protein
MIPSEIRDRIRDGLISTLSNHGFNGRSSTFSREVGDVVHLLQLQSSQGNSSGSARFTLNVAVWVPALASDAKPSVADSHWNRRLGYLGPENSDLWWQANDFEMADDAAKDIAGRINSFAVPALDQLRSTEDLLALWRSGSSPGLTGVQADRMRRQLEARRGRA